MKDPRTDEELNRIITQWHVGLLYVIKKHGLYYRENANGYTDNPDAAWKVPADVAQKHEYNPRGCEDPVTIERAPRLDYCSDLNAVRKAERKWCAQQAPENATHPRFKLAAALYNLAVPAGEQPCFAEARQRAEALVSVIESR